MSEETNHPSWIAFMVYLMILVGSNMATAFGVYEMGKAKGISNTIKENPQNVYQCANGHVEVDQSTKKAGYMFGIKPAKAWGIGICHD